MPADKSRPSSIRGCRCDGKSTDSFNFGSRTNVLEGMRRFVSLDTGSKRAAMWRKGDCDCPCPGIVLALPLGVGNRIIGIASSVVVAVGCVICIGGICCCCCCRVRDELCARGRDDDRGGTLPGGTLYMLDMLLLSPGLFGDGVREDRPR